MKFEIFIHKILPTISLFLGSFAVTPIFYLFGAVIYDLFMQNKEPLSNVYIVFITQGAGVFVGDLLSIAFIKYIDTVLTMGIATSLAALATIVFGISSNFILTNIALFVGGISVEICAIVGVILCLDIWKEQSPTFLQFFCTATGIGTFVGLIFLSEFLSSKAGTMHISLVDVLRNYMLPDAQFPVFSSNKTSLQGFTQTFYYIPFVIYGGIMSLVCVAFFIVFAYKYRGVADYSEINNDLDNVDLQNPKSPMPMSVMIGLCIMTFNIFGLQNNQSNIFTMYAVESGHGISTKYASYMIAAMQAASIFTRVLSVFTTKLYGTSGILMMSASCLTIGSILLLITGRISITMLWVSWVLIGLGTGPLYPLTISWMIENYCIERFHSTMIMVIGNLGYVILGVVAAFGQVLFGSISFEIINTTSSLCYLVTAAINEIIKRR